MVSGTSPSPSLRERKKAATRSAILSNARRLFKQRGYGRVTVAEIADAADISVKTLFTYFRSKEELAFADTSLIDSLADALRHRPATTTPAEAVGQVLAERIAAGEAGGMGVEGFYRGIGQYEELRSPLLRMWADYEDRLAAALADRTALTSPTPAMRLAAMQLIGVLRSFTLPEMRHLLVDVDRDRQQEVLIDWLNQAVAQVDQGLAQLAAPSRQFHGR